MGSNGCKPALHHDRGIPLSQFFVDGGGASVPEFFVTDAGTAIASSHILNVLGGPGTSTTGSGNTITVSVAGAGFTWSVVTSANNVKTLIKENGYISKGIPQVVFVLPLTAAIGDTYRIVGYGNLFQITQNAGQNISLGFDTTTAGVLGSVTATSSRDTLEIVCVTANLEFQIVDSTGNPSFI